MCRLLILILLAGSLVTSWASAQEMYRWVDENGNVHYSDRPPEKETQQLEQITVDVDISEQRRAEAQARLEQTQGNLNQSREAQAEEEAERQRQASEIEQRNKAKQARCELARYNLRALEEVGPVYSVNEAGERVYLEDSARAARTAEYRRLAQEACSND